MATILQHFAGLFTYGLALDEELSSGGQAHRTPDQIYSELRRRVEDAKLAALEGQKRSEDVQEATFAVVAWLDEIIARHPAFWEAATSLQVTLFDTTNAGDEFFTHLSSLSAQQDEVREVYYVALCLGFVGRYYYEVGDQGELGRIKEMHVRHLPTTPVQLHTLTDEKITAQPYRVSDPPGPRMPSRWPEKVARGGILAAFAIVIGLLGYYLWPREVKPPPIEKVEEVVQRYACHDFQVAEQPSSGRLEVRGHMRTASEKERMTREILALPGGAKVVFEIQTLSEPFCEVVGLVAPLRQANQESGAGFRVNVRGGTDHLIEDQLITLDVKLPARPACLYVDYFVADGTAVVHLFPSGDEAQACGLSDRTVSIGEPNSRKVPWKVTPPFGREMVLAIASPTPLFGQPRQGIESPRDYLNALRAAIGASGGELLADYVLVITEKKAQ